MKKKNRSYSKLFCLNRASHGIHAFQGIIYHLIIVALHTSKLDKIMSTINYQLGMKTIKISFLFICLIGV